MDRNCIFNSWNDQIKQIGIEYLIVQIIAVVMYPCSVHPDLNLESVFLLECHKMPQALVPHAWEPKTFQQCA